MREYATLFTGGDLFGVGAEAAGLTASWGIECDSAVADYAERNTGARVIREYVERVDFSTLPVPFWLHMSPVCKNASQAKKDGKEEKEDLESAEGCARAIDILQPPNISLENVYNYRNFESFRIILRALERNGYSFNYWHLNAADFGVPQTRQRLILLASRTHRPTKPIRTHTKNPSPAGLFGDGLPKWVGWYAAIEDLIPTLPESKFAPWQLKRLPKHLQSFLIRNDNTGQEWGNSYRSEDEPAPSLSTTKGARAFILDDQRDGFNDGVRMRDHDEPIYALTTRPASKCRAFILDGKGNQMNAPDGGSVTTREDDEPVMTVVAQSGGRQPMRAFIAQGTSTLDVRADDEPSACVLATVHAKAAKPKAFLIQTDGAMNLHEGKELRQYAPDEPCFTLRTMGQRSDIARAWLEQGRVVSMAPRALARFQSVPDSYELPQHNGLACRIIGNGVPSLFSQRIIESHLQMLKRAA